MTGEILHGSTIFLSLKEPPAIFHYEEIATNAYL